MKGYKNSLAQMRQRVVGTLWLIALAPLLLLIAMHVLGLMTVALWQVAKPVMPYIVVLLILLGLYRLIISRYRS